MRGEFVKLRMQKEIDYEYNEFLRDMNNSLVFGTYMDEDEYEDEYSRDDTEQSMDILEEKIRNYLHENRPGEFVVTSGWCVHVMTLERARKSKVFERAIDDFIVR